MSDLRDALVAALVGRTCVVGVGNVELSDDGVGPRVAAALGGRGFDEAVVAGTTPERWMERLTSGDYDNVLFVDALEFEGAPGSAVLLEGRDIRTRLPQVSTHRISLGTLAELIERRAETRVYLLGVKPGTLRPEGPLSPAVQETSAALTAILQAVLASGEGHDKRRRHGSRESASGAAPAMGECLSR